MSEISVPQVGKFQISEIQIRVVKIGTSEVGIRQIHLTQISELQRVGIDRCKQVPVYVLYLYHLTLSM